ncbi:MAG: tail fiber protein [Sulfuriferula sp.]
MSNMDALPVGFIVAVKVPEGKDIPLMPDNWLQCKGQSLRRAGKYAELFERIGDAHGGNGKTTFKLPKLHRVNEDEHHTEIGFIKFKPVPTKVLP